MLHSQSPTPISASSTRLAVDMCSTYLAEVMGISCALVTDSKWWPDYERSTVSLALEPGVVAGGLDGLAVALGLQVVP